MGLFSRRNTPEQVLQQFCQLLNNKSNFKQAKLDRTANDGLPMVTAMHADAPVLLAAAQHEDGGIFLELAYPAIPYGNYNENQLKRMAEQDIDYQYVGVNFYNTGQGYNPSLTLYVDPSVEANAEGLFISTGLLMECATRMAQGFYRRGIL